MKKILFLLVALVSSLTASAGLDISVTQGDKKFFKTAEGNAVLELLWDGATYDGKMPLEEKFTNLSYLKKVAYNGFEETFNDKSKKFKIVKDQSAAKYKITMKVSKMDQYFKVMGFIPGNATKVWGTLTVTEIATGNVVLVVNVDEVDGGANPSPDETFSDCFEELAEQLTKLK